MLSEDAKKHREELIESLKDTDFANAFLDTMLDQKLSASSGMVVIVTGGRHYANKQLVRRVLDFLKPDKVVQGGATGADALALNWAKDKDVEWKTYPADWTQFGKAAGPIRNKAMLEAHPFALVLAFPGNVGTAGCVQMAEKRNMLVWRIM